MNLKEAGPGVQRNDVLAGSDEGIVDQARCTQPGPIKRRCDLKGPNLTRGSAHGTVRNPNMLKCLRYGGCLMGAFTVCLCVVGSELSWWSGGTSNAAGTMALQSHQGLQALGLNRTVSGGEGPEDRIVPRSTVVDVVEDTQALHADNVPMGGDGCPILLKAPKPARDNFIQSCRAHKGNTLSCLRFGTEYGGHEVPYPLCWLKPGDVYYGFGCGEDISFDVSLGGAYDLKMRLFDPTPKAVRHVNAVLHALDTHAIPASVPSRGRDKYYHEGLVQEISAGVNAGTWFEKIVRTGVNSSHIDFHPWALANANQNMTFFEPPEGVSHSLLKTKHRRGRQISVVARDLSSILAELRDARVSVMKIDIEGYEIVLIPLLLKLFRTWASRDWPRMLLFDMDSLRPGHGNYNQSEGQKCVELIRDAGYDLFSSHHHDYTFVLKA